MSIFVASQQGKTNEIIQSIAAIKEQGKAVDQFLNATDSNGKSALHYAAENGRLEVTKILLQHGANPNLPNRATQSTPIHMAAFYGHAG